MARQERVVARHPRMGRFLLALFDDPQSTRAWAAGAEGGVRGQHPGQKPLSDTPRVLNDRRIPRTRANLNHLVVCPSDVFVVDASDTATGGPSPRSTGI